MFSLATRNRPCCSGIKSVKQIAKQFGKLEHVATCGKLGNEQAFGAGAKPTWGERNLATHTTGAKASQIEMLQNQEWELN